VLLCWQADKGHTDNLTSMSLTTEWDTMGRYGGVRFWRCYLLSPFHVDGIGDSTSRNFTPLCKGAHRAWWQAIRDLTGDQRRARLAVHKLVTARQQVRRPLKPALLLQGGSNPYRQFQNAKLALHDWRQLWGKPGQDLRVVAPFAHLRRRRL